MNFQTTVMAGLAILLITGCSGPQAAPAQPPRDPDVQGYSPAASPADVSVPAPMPAVAVPQRITRIIDKDPDGDGIANRRITITEIFDAAGVLRESVREVDVEADGIIDAREVTTYPE